MTHKSCNTCQFVATRMAEFPCNSCDQDRNKWTKKESALDAGLKITTADFRVEDADEEEDFIPNRFRDIPPIGDQQLLHDLREYIKEKTVPAPDVVNSPSHYTVGGIETIDYMKAKSSPEEFKGLNATNGVVAR